MSTRCAARPDDLHRAALDLEHLAGELATEIRAFESAVALFEMVRCGPFALLRHHDPLGVLPEAVADLAAWVDDVAVAFARAGQGLALDPGAVVNADRRTVDGWLAADAWRPGAHLNRATSSHDWFDAVVGRVCAGFDGAGYLGAGFLVGPDGR